jgi:hypothetical protein
MHTFWMMMDNTIKSNSWLFSMLHYLTNKIITFIYIFILFTMDVFGLFKKILVVKLEWSWMKTFCILASITLLPFGVRVDVFL